MEIFKIVGRRSSYGSVKGTDIYTHTDLGSFLVFVRRTNKKVSSIYSVSILHKTDLRYNILEKQGHLLEVRSLGINPSKFFHTLFMKIEKRKITGEDTHIAVRNYRKEHGDFRNSL